MKISVIIATYNRVEDLESALRAIKNNNKLPYEIIVVDQGDRALTKVVLKKFAFLNIHHEFCKIPSLTSARNIGIHKSQGDTLLFIDDDVELENGAIEAIEIYFNKNKNVLGINGRDLNYSHGGSFSKRLVGVLTGMSSWKDYNVVLSTGWVVLRNSGDIESSIEWMSGCNMAFRKKIFEDGFQFNSEMRRWCLFEDALFSHLVYQNYGDVLRYVPKLQLRHNQSKASRMQNNEVVKMTLVHHYYFWRETQSEKYLSTVSYVWSVTCFIIWMFWLEVSVTALKLRLSTLLFLIKNKDASFEPCYNEFIFNYKKNV